MEEEITSIEKNDTWKLVKAPKSCKPIRVKWVYKLKKNPLGEIVKHKARLVVKGYRQRYGIDYDEVFPLVAHFESISILIASIELYRHHNSSVIQFLSLLDMFPHPRSA